jgi:outer membrane lipoprotein SlyB
VIDGEAKMHKTILISALFAVLLGPICLPSWAQKAGQSVAIQYGKVTGVRDVDLNSGAVPAGVLVGGTLGLMSGSGKSSGKKARNAIVGAAAGGAIAGAAQGSQKGALYQIDVGAGGVVQVVSDQREIRTGDCVAVEKAGDTANVRRVSEGYCQKANESAVKAVADASRKEAEECASVKQQLVDATTPQEADLASRKVALLCND